MYKRQALAIAALLASSCSFFCSSILSFSDLAALCAASSVASVCASVRLINSDKVLTKSAEALSSSSISLVAAFLFRLDSFCNLILSLRALLNSLFTLFLLIGL